MKSDSNVSESDGFRQSILRQIAINRARTPNERFLAMCDLLDAARAMAPMDEASRLRRLRAKAARELEKEKWRAECSRFAALYPNDPEV